MTIKLIEVSTKVKTTDNFVYITNVGKFKRSGNTVKYSTIKERYWEDFFCLVPRKNIENKFVWLKNVERRFTQSTYSTPRRYDVKTGYEYRVPKFENERYIWPV